MKKIKLSEEEKQEIEMKKKEYTRDWKILKRLRCIELRNEGKKNKEIMQILEVSEDAITKYCKIYLEKGLEELCKLRYEGRVVSQLESYKEEIEKMVNEKIYGSYKELLGEVKEISGNITIKLHGFIKFCKKKGIGLQKTVK